MITMDKFWICFVLLGVVIAVNGSGSDEDVPDYWNNNDNSNYNPQGESIETGDYYEEVNEAANIKKIEEETKLELEKEVQQLSERTKYDINEDYQYEDNRSEPKDEPKNMPDSIEKIQQSTSEIVGGIVAPVTDNQHDYSNNFPFQNTNGADTINNDDVHPLEPTPIDNNDNNDFFRETQALLEKDNNNLDDLVADASEQVETVVSMEGNFRPINNDDTILSAEQDVYQKNNEKESVEDMETQNSFESIDGSIESQNDVDDVNLSGDLDQIYQTWDRLKDTDTSSNQELDGNSEINKSVDELTKTEKEELETNETDLEDQIFDRITNNEKTISAEQENIPKSSEIEINKNSFESDDGSMELQNSEDEETVDNVYKDLQGDLEQLFETWNKLSDSEGFSKEKVDQILPTNEMDNDLAETKKSESNFRDDLFDTGLQKKENSDEVIDNIDNSFNLEDILDYEQKYGRPFREGNILKQRDYDEYDDTLQDIFEAVKSQEETNQDDIINPQQDSDYENVGDDDLEKLFDQNVKSGEISSEHKDTKSGESGLDKDNNVSLNKITDDQKNEFSSEAVEKVIKTDKNNEEQQSFDGDEEGIDSNNASEEILDSSTELITEKKPVIHEVKTMKVVDLQPSDYDRFMEQFSVIHDSEMEPTDCENNPGQIHVSLKVDTPTVISSCGFPDRYPTNKLMDWVIEGDGRGIELNVTDIDINGVLGDYLLIKPGGVDASGADGIIFSYQINSPRKYRFLDVDRLFVRFESRLGLAFRTGFRLSVRMFAPIPAEPEPAPEPAPLLPEPTDTLTINLGGVTMEKFLAIENEFLRIISDMATLYINANNIPQGLNTTSEVAQIVTRSICNIHWPDTENCVEVEFGVPLVYDDDEDNTRLDADDLRAMWYTYVYMDPFAARLRRLGITEFAVPNDSAVLMVWMVIAVGVLISVAMLAFALWQANCFQDYTRMAAFSDTDSLTREKRALDLYPTPHQALPPLYSDPPQWPDEKPDTTRVDMGGYANKSYVQDDLFNIDSDEEVISPRDRKDKRSQRDIHKV